MIQSEKRILFLAESSLKGENPQLWRIRLKERSPCVSPRNHQYSAYSTRGARKGARGDPCTRPAGARVTCGVSARSRRVQGRGRAEAAAQARPDSRALGGRRGGGRGGRSVRFGRRTRIPARRPGPAPRGEPGKGATVTQ